MSTTPPSRPAPDAPASASPPISAESLVNARREKLQRWRDAMGVTGYGHRVDGLLSLSAARARFDPAAHAAVAAADAAKQPLAEDPRALVSVGGRCVQHRAMGKLVFLVLRDETGDLQISISKAMVGDEGFKLAEKLDYGDIIVAEGRIGQTNKGEICVWASRLALHGKSLAPPPDKYHGLSDAELRYRQRYVDMYVTPSTMQTFRARSKIVSGIRAYMEGREFLEVETPMMQPMAGGAAARPFITHHNTLDMKLFLRIAPELYLKRLLVGGMRRVYEINRNFRNEGVDRSHNPEFTALEAYEAFGDCDTMRELTQGLLHTLAARSPGHATGSSFRTTWGSFEIDWSLPFATTTYGELFRRGLGFDMADEAKVQRAARELHIPGAEKLDHWLLVNEIFEEKCEGLLDGNRPTFVTDYPSAISPLTRPHPDRPHLCGRWDLLIAGMEIGTAYTELNDPDIQLAKFTEQLRGADEEETTLRTLDEDFLNALRVGMPPAGGLGLGVDRIVMLLTGQTTIRDVILFPLLKPGE